MVEGAIILVFAGILNDLLWRKKMGNQFHSRPTPKIQWVTFIGFIILGWAILSRWYPTS
jgi:hypothetical protein